MNRRAKKKDDLVIESKVENFEPASETVEEVVIDEQPIVEEIPRDFKKEIEELLNNKETVEYFKARNIEAINDQSKFDKIKLEAIAAMLYTKKNASEIAMLYIRNIINDIYRIDKSVDKYDENIIVNLIGNVVALKKHISLYGEIINLEECCNNAIETEYMIDIDALQKDHISNVKYQIDRIKSIVEASNASNKDSIIELLECGICDLLK